MSTHNIGFYEEIRNIISLSSNTHFICGEARWPSGRASDSRARGPGFDPHSGRRVVSLEQDTFTFQKVLVIPRKLCQSPDMIEKLLTGT